jgi:hypothetical protein
VKSKDNKNMIWYKRRVLSKSSMISTHANKLSLLKKKGQMSTKNSKSSTNNKSLNLQKYNKKDVNNLPP